MYTRELEDLTLEGLQDRLASVPVQSIRTNDTAVRVDLSGGETKQIMVGDLEIPATSSGLTALSNHFNVPKAFLLRQDPALQETVLNYLSSRSGGEGVYRYSETSGLVEVMSPGQRVISSEEVVDVAVQAIDPVAKVVEFWSEPDSFGLDVVVPEAFDRGIGGDRQVGDLTHGGVRFRQNRKQNLAPEIAEFYLRLICLNGMEVPVEGEKIEARGLTSDEVVEEMHVVAKSVMGRLEARIERFYAMRSEKVSKPEQVIARLAEEHGVSDRVAFSLVKSVPTLGEEPSMFDLVNLLTNEANEASLRSRPGAARRLERAGGGVVFEHCQRCLACQAKLN